VLVLVSYRILATEKKQPATVSYTLQVFSDFFQPCNVGPMRSPCTTKPPGKAKWRPPWSLPPPTSLPPSTLSSSSLHPHEFRLSPSYSASSLTPSRHQPIRPPPPRNQGYAKGLAVIDRPLLLLAWVCHRLLHHWHCLSLSLLMLPHPMYIMLWGCMHMVRN
jgi:hypothetical protein